MPPQFQTPKQVLMQQAELPKFALANSPIAALGEGLSSLLMSAAGAVPDAPLGPPQVGGRAVLPPVPQLFASLEAILPAGAPKLSEVVGGVEVQGGGARRGATIGPQAGEPPPTGKTIKIGV